MKKDELKEALEDMGFPLSGKETKTELEKIYSSSQVLQDIDESITEIVNDELESESNTEEAEQPISDAPIDNRTEWPDKSGIWQIKEGGTIDYKGMRITSNDLHERLIEQLIADGLGDHLEQV